MKEIRNREKATLDRWDQVLQLLGVDKDKLEIETLSVIFIALQQELDTAEPGSHLLDVQEKLQFQIQKTRDVQEKWEIMENKASETNKRQVYAVGMPLCTIRVKTLHEKINSLREEERKAVSSGWQGKGNLLRQVLQAFNREVDQLETSTSAQAKLLENLIVGDNIPEAKKHQVLEEEMKTNAWQLKVLNRTDQLMVQRIHNIGEELAGLISDWESLIEAVKEGSKLCRAAAQIDIRMSDEIKIKLGDIKSLKNSNDTGEDLRGCKPTAEAELATVDQKVAGLGNVAAVLADGHLDGFAILTNCNDLTNKVELEWISKNFTKYVPMEIQFLQQAQSFGKIHKLEVVNNRCVVEGKVVETGLKLFKMRVQAAEDKFSTCENIVKRLESSDKDVNSVDVKAKLAIEWMFLIEAIKERNMIIKSAGKIHRYNRDIAREGLARIGEKNAILQTEDEVEAESETREKTPSEVDALGKEMASEEQAIGGGRGDLLSCGDIEENPGPTSPER